MRSLCATIRKISRKGARVVLLGSLVAVSAFARAEAPNDIAAVRAYSDREIGKLLAGDSTVLLISNEIDYYPVIHIARGYQLDRVTSIAPHEYLVLMHFTVDKWLSQDAEDHKIMVHDEAFDAKYSFIVAIESGGAAQLKGAGIPTPNVKAGKEKSYLISQKP
jgi:hypothetical protein